jgi:hypothetical protein
MKVNPDINKNFKNNKMKLKLIFSSLFILFCLSLSFGQMKMIYGKKYLIFAEIPKNWLQMPIEQAPFFIKPDKKNVDNKTYMYIMGLDYSINPDLNGWIDGIEEK